MEWYEKLDFEENPFSINPEEHLDKLVNMEEIIQEMNYRISSGSLLVIEGDEGSGKTSLLMLAAKKFGGQKNVAYVDCKILDKKLNITHVLQDRFGILGRLFDKKPKNMILLMDNVQELSKINNERLKYYFDQNYIKSIVFTTKKFSMAKFSESMKDRIGRRIVKTPKLDEYDAISLIKRRIGEKDIFNDELIKKIFKMSKNPKELLQNCEKVAMYAVKKGRNRVQLSDLKALDILEKETEKELEGDKNEWIMV